ncbi:monovalent cation/H(+) antiporter subunit G [Papillibacter cinnamivorans]|uniref:Multicomponent Na+:H+ antiporter subunit G n=1 Tax=Papillibacter cinnamivorans DSM 12816 TaxID=1122930 RepID=A0A1W2C4G9_9FIRM|nr:monovalent cation/H(+) antiporter subunit G [Papillibacter cinnamivorans]SMC80147.1 multicomponent Na+:H+ antiporter subunit G [Papillibacter cinnamivorans DSM 12816]
MNVVIGSILIFCGVFFVVVAAIGVVRLPDFYARLHASGKAETLGAILCLTGLAVYCGPNQTSLKLILIIFFLLFANPVGTHVISRAAFRYGILPWKKRKE